MLTSGNVLDSKEFLFLTKVTEILSSSLNLQEAVTSIFELFHVELNIKNRFSFFEITKAEHHHFFCNECDKVFCLDNQNSKISLIQSLVENNNFSVESHEFNLYGTCQPCLERTNN